MTEIVGDGRFQLAEDRVRNLLMGEALYKDTSLAIRELYQNAVDATRHAAARIEWLNRLSSNRPPTPYAGDVDLTQAAKGAGEYIDCTDNGVGMGLREITGVFAQAGMRSADSPDFIAEMADYAHLDPPIDLWTNSRFGIGALSYFMLADRIEITTTRLHRDGTLGPTFHVDITGPETYFRITEIDQAPSHGTTVRLWLREPGSVSAIAVLGKILIVAPVHVRVSEPRTGGEITWPPDQLATDCVPDPARRVWWVPTFQGRVLSDGLVTTTQLLGAYLDLRGSHSPKLTVDRNELVDYDVDYVRRTLVASADTLVRDATQDQLEKICLPVLGITTPGDFVVADAVSDGLARRDVVRKISSWPGVYPTNLARSGFIPGFTPIMAENWIASAAALGDPQCALRLDDPSWGDIVRPRPSDGFLLSDDKYDLMVRLGQDPFSGQWPLSMLGISAANCERSPGEVLARYEELGISFPHWRPDLRWDETVKEILNRKSLARESMSEMAMAQMGVKLGISIHEVAEILDEWEVPHESVLLFADHRPTLTEELFFYDEYFPHFDQRDSSSNWCHRGTPIPVYRLADISTYLHQGLREVAQTARYLGFEVATPVVDSLTDLHRLVLTYDTKWEILGLARENGLSPSRLVEAANELGAGFDPYPRLDIAPDMGEFEPQQEDGGLLHRSAVLIAHQASSTPVDEVIAAFEWAGFELVGPDLEDMDSLDLALTNDDSIDCVSVVDVSQPLNPYWVMVQAQRRGLGAAEVLRRYLRLGFTVTSPEFVTEPTINLLMLVSKSGGMPDIDTPLLEPESVVTASRVLLAVRQTRLSIDDVLTMYVSLGLHPEDPRVVLPVLRPGPIPPS